jgi:hypothetical protein
VAAKEVGRSRLFEASFDQAYCPCVLAHALVLSEEVNLPPGESREQLACDIGKRFLELPGLQEYCRIGMYEYLGVAEIERAPLAAWLAEAFYVTGRKLRWGIFAERVSPRRVDRLLLGTAKCARAQPEQYLFELEEDDWVRPVSR